MTINCLHLVSFIKLSVLFHAIGDTLAQMNLSSFKIRAISYDRASNMSGAKRGVDKLVQDIELS